MAIRVVFVSCSRVVPNFARSNRNYINYLIIDTNGKS